MYGQKEIQEISEGITQNKRGGSLSLPVCFLRYDCPYNQGCFGVMQLKAASAERPSLLKDN